MPGLSVSLSDKYICFCILTVAALCACVMCLYGNTCLSAVMCVLFVCTVKTYVDNHCKNIFPSGNSLKNLVGNSPKSISILPYFRVGLMGNPSDGFHGKTISLSIANFWAEVTITESEKLVSVYTEHMP